MPDLDDIASRYAADTYLLRRKFFRIFGGGFHLYGPDGDLRLYTEMKRFKLREDIRLFAEESMDTEVLRISTKSIFDISGSYAVTDSLSGETVGGLRRKGLKSFFKDEWLILDEAGEEVGTIKEDGTFRALARRAHGAAAMLLPQGFQVEVGGTPVATFKQQFNPDRPEAGPGLHARHDGPARPPAGSRGGGADPGHRGKTGVALTLPPPAVGLSLRCARSCCMVGPAAGAKPRLRVAATATAGARVGTSTMRAGVEGAPVSLLSRSRSRFGAGGASWNVGRAARGGWWSGGSDSRGPRLWCS